MGKQQKTDALSERHFVQRAPLIPLIPFLQFDIKLDTSILEQTTNLKKFLLQLQDAVPIVRLQIHLSIVPAPLFSGNISFKNAHFVRKEENTLFSYLRIPPESSTPSIFQQENICRWTPTEISSFDPKF